MILVAGGIADSVTELVCARLTACGYPYRLLDLGRYPSGHGLAVRWTDAGPQGHLSGPDWTLDLDEISGVYVRFLGPEGRLPMPNVPPATSFCGAPPTFAEHGGEARVRREVAEEGGVVPVHDPWEDVAVVEAVVPVPAIAEAPLIAVLPLVAVLALIAVRASIAEAVAPAESEVIVEEHHLHHVTPAVRHPEPVPSLVDLERARKRDIRHRAHPPRLAEHLEACIPAEPCMRWRMRQCSSFLRQSICRLIRALAESTRVTPCRSNKDARTQTFL